MKNKINITRTVLLLSVVFLVHCKAVAQLQVGFTPRFSDGVYGDFLTIGNNMLSTTATGNYTGSDGNHNLTTVFVDIDTDISTFNSSSANLTGPLAGTNCVAIKKAYLYWAAADLEESNIANEPNWNYNDIKIMLPGSATYTTLTADNVIYRGRAAHFVNDPYACFKDITALVQAIPSPFGKYQMANVRAKKGTLNPDHTGGNVGTSGGWQIVFVYEGTETDPQGNSVLPAKYITLFDGYANVTSAQNNYNISISGFQTPPVGSVQTKILFGSLEGDRDLTGDQFEIRNVANTFVDLTTGSLRPTNNFFSSRVTTENVDFIDRNPASTNTLGYDIGYFTLNNPSNSIITNNQSSAVLRLTSNQETYGLYLIGFSTDVWAPDLSPLLQTSTPGTANPGDTISYTFTVKNNGNDNAQNIVITRTLPAEVELVQPVTPLPAGVTYSYNVGTRVLSFFVQNGFVDVGDPAINISYKTVIKNQCHFLETACVPSTTAQLLATYIGVQNPATQTTLSSNGVTGCGLGNDKSNITFINQPSEATWVTLAGVLDRTVNCDDVQALSTAQALFPTTNKCNFILNKISGLLIPNTCPIKGKYINTWTFTDKCGRTSPIFTQFITVQDTTKPVITGTPQNITVSCAQDVPQASITSVSATDNCTGEITKTVNDVITNQTCANRYTITRTWTATDVCGNSSTSSQTITVNDQTPPVISGTPQNITVSCASDVPQASIASVSATDNCAGSVTKTVVDVITNQTCANRFTITRTWTATDVCGNSSTSSQTITVNDIIKPVFIEQLPINHTVNCNSIPTAAILTASDNCGQATVIFNESTTPGGCLGSGGITRTWTARDTCGNITIHVQFITVQDTTKPVITGTPQNITVSCAQDVPQASITSVSATDNCTGEITKTVNDVITNQTCANRYTITRTWTATDVCGNSSTSSQTITVNDLTPPVISGTPQNITVSCAQDVPQASIASVSASDNCSGSVAKTVVDVITNQTCVNRFTITRTWTATDVCGNNSTSSQTITVNDIINPEFIEVLPLDVTVNCDAIPTAPTLTATDNCGSASVQFNETTTLGGCSSSGGIIRTWTATDACNNTTIHVQTITVQDTTKPVITGTPQNITVSCGSDVPQASTTSVSATDNCAGEITKTVNDVITNQTCVNRYTITRTWTATDVCGNSSTSSQTITVNDIINPEFIEVLPLDVTVNCDVIPTAPTLTATDNCGSASVQFNETTTPGGCSSSGGIIRTWTATDACNNTTIHVQTITVQDTTKPVITGTPQNITVSCASDVPQASTTSVSATDNCAGEITKTVNDVISNQTCANRYTITRTWTATDVCGNSSTSSQTITVNDIINPEFIEVLPLDVTVNCDAIPTAPTLTATDNCGSASVQFNETTTPGGCSSSGGIIRTWTATDACNNTTIHVQTITVQDTTKPVITGTPQNITVSCASDVPQASTTSVSATDNCAGEITKTVNDVITNQTCANRYTITRTWTATDVCGNSSTSSQTITVNDIINPEFIEVLPLDVTVNCDAIPTAPTLTATDNCGSASVQFNETTTPGGCSSSGGIIRTWTATDACNNTTIHVQTITVQDTTKPVITGTPQNITVSCASDVPQASTTSVSATDNCAGEITKTVNDVISNQTCANRYTITRTWRATDVCGNSSTSTQTITVNDTIKPVILETPRNITVSCVADVPQASILSLIVTDNCDDEITVSVSDVITNQTCANRFTITRTFTATDACGNSSTSSQTIIVSDQTPPLISEIPQNIILNCSSDVPLGSILSISASDNCVGTVIVTMNDVIKDQTCANKYTLTRTWTATDVCGNSSTSSQTITVNDLTPPVITGTPENITVSCASDVPQASTASVGATDNCAGEITKTVNDVITNQTCANRYTITRTWTATDVCGNSSISSQTITVNDIINPEFIEVLPLDVTVNCDAIPTAPTLTATDNCGSASVQFNETTTPGGCSSSGGIIRTWTATDACNNTTIHVQTITVQDTTKPFFVGQLPANETVCAIVPVPEILTATDNCSSAIVTFIESIDSTSSSNILVYTRTWTATDLCFNRIIHVQTINVNPVSLSRIDTAVFDCHGGITVGGQVFIEPGTYQIVLQNSYGCDSLITLNLRIRICDTIPIGQDTTIYDSLPVLTTIEICNLSLPPGNNNVIKSCDGSTTGITILGTWTINSQTKCLEYTAGSITGNDTLCISACDTITRQCNTTTVIITVTGLPPIANDDCVEETEKNTEISIAALENDSDPDQDALSLQSIIIQPKHGFVTIEQEGKVIVYTPNKNFCGRDTLYYEVCDSDDGCDTAMVCLYVKCECIMPQVITPNGDGFNDHLVFPCIGEGAKLILWHRNGLIIYESDDYKNDWNGTYKGQETPGGTYFYSIEYKEVESSEIIKKQNYIMVIK